MKKTDTELDVLLDRCDAFCLMTRSAAMLGTRNDPQFDADAAAIIAFLGAAYAWPQTLIETATDCILGPMMRLALTADYLALSSTELLDDELRSNLVLLEIKARAIEEVNRTETVGATSGQRAEHELKSAMGYTAFHHKYEPRLRFAQIRRLAGGGDAAAMLQEAIMRILGVGCRSDVALAQRILQNLLVWGEKSAAILLSYLWGEEGDETLRSYYRSIYDLLDGTRLAPDAEEAAAPDRAEQYLILIGAVQSLIVRGSGRREVDPLFAALLNRDELTFEEKLELIRGYKDGKWLHRWEHRSPRRPVGFAGTK